MNNLNKYTISHWNLLADCRTYDSGFVTHPKHLLWTHRKKLIIKQINENPHDIMCFVELDENQSDLMKYTNMSSDYISVYHRKYNDNSLFQDGCMISYNKHKFRLESNDCYRLHDEHSQIAVVIRLRTNDDRIITVVSAHFKSKPANEKIRISQVDRLHQVLKDYNNIIIATDLNEIPENMAYQNLRDGIDSRNRQIAVVNSNNRKFTDAYGGYKQSYYTTFKTRVNNNKTNTVKRIIDYIFCEKKIFKIKTINRLLSTEDAPDTGFPSGDWPSDHIMIGCSFIFR